MRYEKGNFVVLPNLDALREVSVGARAVFIEICAFSDEYGCCFPSRKTIAENIQMHSNSVDRYISELAQKKIIKKSGRTRKDGSKTTNEYQILVVPLTTHGEGGITTHGEAELYPVLTIPTVTDEATLRGYEVSEDKPITSKIPKKEREAYEALVRWSEQERGFKFLASKRLKQYKALKDAKKNGLKGQELMDRWQEMASDPFWEKAGFDWMNVVDSFNKKRL